SLPRTSIAVRHRATALVVLRCRGRARCVGRLTLTARRTDRAGGVRRTRSVRIGTVSFSIAGERTTVVSVRLNALGRGLLRSAHDRLAARLQITLVGASPSPRTQTRNVRLL